jgi:hypothetical protein
MKRFFFIITTVALLASCSNPYYDYYRQNGTLHPELLAKHRTECIALGFKENSESLAECRKDLAQDWKNNLEARARWNRPQFGIHYGLGGGRW